MRPAALSATIAIAACGLIAWSDRAGPVGNGRPQWYGGTSYFSPTSFRARLALFEERWEKSLRASIDFTVRDAPDVEAAAQEPAIAADGPRPDVPIERVCQTLADAAADSELPLGFFARLIWFESSFRQRLVSRAGAQGMAQFMPKVAEERGLEDPFDPLTALPASARFLRDHYRYFGNWGLAAAAYNAGARRVEEWIARRGPMPEETRNYVRNITGHEPERWLDPKPVELAVHLPKLAPCETVGGLSRRAGPLAVPVFLTATIAKAVEEAKAAAERIRVARAAAAKARLARVAKARIAASAQAKAEPKTPAATPKIAAKPETNPAPVASTKVAAKPAAAPKSAKPVKLADARR
jgi:hypothetical protein